MITLEQIEKDIKSGKSKMIYFGAHSLWWTHLDSDVKEATEQGKAALEKQNEIFFASPTVPQHEKERRRKLLDFLAESQKKTGHSIPTDSRGGVLYQNDKPMQWLTAAYKTPKHFGEHGLEAFLKSHHQNCGGNCFPYWREYNDLIDNEKKALGGLVKPE